MKDPRADLAILAKANVSDPVIAGTASHVDNKAKVLRKFTVRLDEDLLARIRACYLEQLAHGGEHRSLSAWTAAQLEEAVARYEAEAGTPLSPIPTGVIPPGPQ